MDTEVDWDDATIVAPQGPGVKNEKKKVDRFTPEQGVTYRMAILPGKPVRTFSHYKKGYGFFTCRKPDGLECMACADGDRMSEKFNVNALLYPAGPIPSTAPPGTAAPTLAPGQPIDVDNCVVVQWAFNSKVFTDLRQIKGEWGPLENYDLKVTCTNQQFKHMQITPCKEALYLTAPERSALDALIEESRYDLKKILTTYPDTVEEVRAIWAGASRDAIWAARKARRDTEKSAEGAAPAAQAAAAPPPLPAPTMPNFADLLSPPK